jgi:protein TonB
MGLDEKAVEVVRQWKFQPGLEHGKPVPVRMSVEVSFLNY